MMNDTFNRNIEDIRKLKAVVFDLRLKYDAMDDEHLRADVKSIIQIGDSVYAELVRNNSKTPAAHKFINYYLPTIEKIVDRYIVLVKNEINSKESLDIRAEIIKTMPEIKDAMKRYYESMFTSEIMDADIELEVLLKQV